MTCTFNESELDDIAKAVRTLILSGQDAGVLLGMYPEDCRKAISDRLKGFPGPGTSGGAPQGPVAQRRRKEWQPRHNSSNGQLWRLLRQYNFDELERSKEEVNQLHDASDKVLYLLGDPAEQGPKLDKVKGLVVGYVQSGKTANYTALTAKAFDAGFKLVIVLSGVHNSLRRQTQIRMNNELGVVESTERRKTSNKGSLEDHERVTTLTTEDLTTGDFFGSTISSNILGGIKALIVTKKNSHVLDGLIRWIGTAGKGIPTLIIDDEADQATVNTRRGKSRAEYAGFEGDNAEDLDIDPTKINEKIRELLNRFNNVSYVGYTATPYANVFIGIDHYHSKLGEDLYPRDFILSLPKPANYMGPEEFFGGQVTGEDDPEPSNGAIRIVSGIDQDTLEKISPFHDGESPTLPESLVGAIDDFILGTAARWAEVRDNPASTMLIHTSHLKEKQKDIADHVRAYVKGIVDDWRLFHENAEQSWRVKWEKFSNELRFNNPKSRFLLEFSDLEPWIDRLLKTEHETPILLLNYSSQDELDYESNPKLTAIVIGGNKLSRGLTLEGLIVSYFVRKAAAPKADTLTQMGRFFGYRGSLLDITRLYTTDELRSAFVDISIVEESLRREIRELALTGQSPSAYQIRVQRRLGLMPTAQSKMRTAKKDAISYSGDLVQTTSFPKADEFKGKTDHTKLDWNLDLTCEFIATLQSKFGDPYSELWSKAVTGSTYKLSQAKWANVSATVVCEYLAQYQAIEGATRFLPGAIARYVKELSEISTSTPELTLWTVVIAGRSPDSRLGVEDFGTAMSFGRIERSLVAGSEVSIKTLINPLNLDKGTGDELLDFTENEIQEMRRLKAEDPSAKTSHLVRSQRNPNKGLLVIYPISPESIGVGNESAKQGKRGDVTLGASLWGLGALQKTVVGLSLSFPVSRIQPEEYWTQRVGDKPDA